jgi:radical SAM superfamily enzyme YgiQ (UPF0313 family)
MTYDIIIYTNVADFPCQRAIGAYQLAGHLRKYGITVQIIDFTDNFTTEELFEITKKFIGKNTLAVGVSSTFYEGQTIKGFETNRKQTSFLPDNVINTVSLLKERYPSIRFILGGANSRKYQFDGLFSAVFHNYSENSFLEYIREIKNDRKRLWPKNNGTEIIDGALFPFDIRSLEYDWAQNDHIFKGEVLPIEISRGCIFKCKFCNYPYNGKNHLDYLRDPYLIKDEIVRNYEKYGTTDYMFGDDTFNDTTYKLEGLYNVLRDLPFKIKFSTYLRLDLLHAHKEQISLLKEMGLAYAFMGIETFDPKTAKFVNKSLHSNKVKDLILKLKNEYWKDEVSFQCTFIVGLPTEPITSTDKTFQWLMDNKINNYWSPLWINPNKWWKSDIDTNYEKYGYRNVSDSYWEHDIMSRHEANEAATRYNSLAIPNQELEMSVSNSLINLGYSREYIRKTPLKDLPLEEIKIKAEAKMKEYKNCLANEK